MDEKLMEKITNTYIFLLDVWRYNYWDPCLQDADRALQRALTALRRRPHLYASIGTAIEDYVQVINEITVHQHCRTLSDLIGCCNFGQKSK